MTFVWKVCDLDLKAMPQLGDGAEKNFIPIYTIMLNINETNKSVFIINLDAFFFLLLYEIDRDLKVIPRDGDGAK